MWVVSEGGVMGNNIFAYNMENKTRVTAKEFVLQDGSNSNYRALWSNGVTMWLLDGTKILAYTLATGDRDEDKDFPLVPADPTDTSNNLPADSRGIWANQSSTTSFENATIWIATDNEILAFSLSSKMRTPMP